MGEGGCGEERVGDRSWIKTECGHPRGKGEEPQRRIHEKGKN